MFEQLEGEVIPVEYDRFRCPDCETLRAIKHITIKDGQVVVTEVCDAVRCPGGVGPKTREINPGNTYNPRTHGIYPLATMRAQYKPGMKPEGE